MGAPSALRAVNLSCWVIAEMSQIHSSKATTRRAPPGRKTPVITKKQKEDNPLSEAPGMP